MSPELIWGCKSTGVLQWILLTGWEVTEDTLVCCASCAWVGQGAWAVAYVQRSVSEARITLLNLKTKWDRRLGGFMGAIPFEEVPWVSWGDDAGD